MLTLHFNQTIDTWLKELERYNFDQLCAKPSPNSWSLGQVYMHLIDQTNYYLEQIKICLSTNDHESDEASPAAREMFFNNEFPDEVLEGPPSNASTPQPETKEQLRDCLTSLRREMTEVGSLISKSPFKGKTKHPGLDYFSAGEWLQFAEMHLRHHLRQKRRLDGFLKTTSPGV